MNHLAHNTAANHCFSLDINNKRHDHQTGNQVHINKNKEFNSVPSFYDHEPVLAGLLLSHRCQRHGILTHWIVLA